MALFSVVCLLAKQLNENQTIKPNATAWYKKKRITFSDVLARVRLEILSKTKLFTSTEKTLVNSYPEKIKHLWFLLTQTVA